MKELQCNDERMCLLNKFKNIDPIPTGQAVMRVRVRPYPDGLEI